MSKCCYASLGRLQYQHDMASTTTLLVVISIIRLSRRRRNKNLMKSMIIYTLFSTATVGQTTYCHFKLLAFCCDGRVENNMSATNLLKYWYSAKVYYTQSLLNIGIKVKEAEIKLKSKKTLLVARSSQGWNKGHER